ncbi:hypothetical protein Y032_0155g3034 [Ancylostoma ceylanicum]|uniref:Uncharacterized protein n=1 Tax=Ancylostoma ceylanicum TaxID=53326 RepID=A0A016SYI4_9BILA|nr:hypothetical protein Y032_0155g3034 [Ancylostoma ceylanicum]
MVTHNFRSQPPCDGRGNDPMASTIMKPIDHIVVNRRFCLTDVSVVPKFYTDQTIASWAQDPSSHAKDRKRQSSRRRVPHPSSTGQLPAYVRARKTVQRSDKRRAQEEKSSSGGRSRGGRENHLQHPPRLRQYQDDCS